MFNLFPQLCLFVNDGYRHSNKKRHHMHICRIRSFSKQLLDLLSSESEKHRSQGMWSDESSWYHRSRPATFIAAYLPSWSSQFSCHSVCIHFHRMWPRVVYFVEDKTERRCFPKRNTGVYRSSAGQWHICIIMPSGLMVCCSFCPCLLVNQWTSYAALLVHSGYFTGHWCCHEFGILFSSTWASGKKRKRGKRKKPYPNF